MAMFVVRPGQSYHAVQEVQTDRAPRLSIQGWFHGPTPLEGSDQASLSQIMSKEGANAMSMIPLHELPKASPSLTVEEKDVLFLKQWINGLYLGTDVQSKINSEFIQNSSIQREVLDQIIVGSHFSSGPRE